MSPLQGEGRGFEPLSAHPIHLLVPGHHSAGEKAACRYAATMPDAVVIGGGVVGTACAYELARRGSTVTLVERDELAAGASGRNQGWFVLLTIHRCGR